MNLEVLADVADADEMYEESLTNIRNRKPIFKKPKPVPVLSAAEQEAAAKDYYASVRTNVCGRFSLSFVRLRQLKLMCNVGPAGMGTFECELLKLRL